MPDVGHSTSHAVVGHVDREQAKADPDSATRKCYFLGYLLWRLFMSATGREDLVERDVEKAYDECGALFG